MSSGYDVIISIKQRHSCTYSNVIRQTDTIMQKRRRHAFGLGFPPEPEMAINFFQQPGLTNAAKVMKMFEATSPYSIIWIRRLYRYVKFCKPPMDNMRCSALFNSKVIPIISGRWEGDN